MLTMLDGAVGAVLGVGAQMDDTERRLIEDPMARVMARMDPTRSAVLERWLDPILLLYGISAWGVRIYSDLAQQADDDDRGPPRPPEPPSPPRSPNGHEVPSAGPGEDLLGQMLPQAIVVEVPVLETPSVEVEYGEPDPRDAARSQHGL